jgi:hypothetical protein
VVTPHSAPSCWRLVVDALAAYRLTRLVTADVLTEDARRTVVDVAYSLAGRVPPEADTAEEVVAADPDEPPKLAVLVTCRWCAGMWVALGVVFIARRFRWWPAMADALALSATAALVAGLEE